MAGSQLRQSMTTAHKRDAFYSYSAKLFDVGCGVAAQAKVELGPKWARDPKVVALTLLCRTLGNMKGAVALLVQRLLLEAQILTRRCAENSICIGALQTTGDVFVEELLRADAASKKKHASLAIGAYSGNEEQAATIARLSEIVKTIEATHPKARPLNIKELSKNNPLGVSYIVFSVLSERAAHISAKSLGRHLGRDVEEDKISLLVNIAPDPTEEQLVEVLRQLLATVLSVVVGANEIVGGTEPGLQLGALTSEFEAIREG
jgi:hypothetical protein